MRWTARFFSLNMRAVIRQKRKWRKPILMIQHAPHEHPAAVLDALENRGIATQWIHPYRGERYPAVDEIGGVISLGGPMGANDEEEHPWIKTECALLRESVFEELPVAGICLGGQMLAKALGGYVERSSRAEIGWFPLELSAEGKADRILNVRGLPPTVYQWHQDTFHLPSEAVLLAGSEACERQAYRVGEHAYGFQFHPEADHRLIHEWLATDGAEAEVSDWIRLHGPETIQTPEFQRRMAADAEINSRELSNAIAELFTGVTVD